MSRRARGEIVKVGDLFAVYKNRLRAPQGSVVNACITVIQDICNYTINPTQCSYSVRTRILHVRVTGPLKSEIMIQKTKILDELKRVLGEKGYPLDIL